jgi:MFS family permease
MIIARRAGTSLTQTDDAAAADPTLNVPKGDVVSQVEPRENSLAKTLVVILGPSLVSFVPMAVAPALPRIAEHFGAGSDGALFAQMVMTVPAILLIVSATLAGVLAERLGRRRVLLAALALFVLAGTAGLYVPDATTLIVARLLLGLAGGAVLTSSLSLASDFPEGGPRERVLGFAGAGGAAGAIIALNAGGWLVDAGGWRAAFALYALGLVALVPAWFGLRSHAHVGGESHSLLEPLRRLWPVYLVVIAFAIGLFMPGIQAPFLLQGERVTSAATQGLIVSASSVAAVIAASCYGWLARVLSLRSQLVSVAACLGLGSLVNGFAHGALPIAVGCAMTGMGGGLNEPVLVSVLFSRTPEAARTRAVGLLLSAIFLGQFLNPLAVDPLRGAWGIHGAFVAVGLALVAVAVLLAVGGGVISGRDEVKWGHSLFRPGTK